MAIVTGMDGCGDYLLRPGEIVKPPANNDTAKELAQRLYGLTAKHIKEMVSYDDRNFHVTVETSYDNPHITALCPFGYTLKIANRIDSKNTSLTDSMDKILLLAGSKGLEVPIPVKNRFGNYWSLELLDDENGSSDSYIVRMLTFLPGTTVYHIPYTPSVLYQWGHLLARFHEATKGHVDRNLQKRSTPWSLLNLPMLKEFIYAVEDERHRHLVTEIINKFSDVQKAANSLPKAIIHGDFNEHNILVQQKGENVETSGILDLGDIQVAPIVFDVAVMLTYTMIECRTMDPLEAPGHALAGYLSLLPLMDNEKKMLKMCISARLCQSLVMGAYTYSLDPSNKYVLSTSRTGWAILEKLWDTAEEKLYEMWENIICSNYSTKYNLFREKNVS